MPRYEHFWIFLYILYTLANIAAESWISSKYVLYTAIFFSTFFLGVKEENDGTFLKSIWCK